MLQKVVIDWAINQVIAWIVRWLDSNQPTQALHDPKPAPIVKPKPGAPRKYAPVSTAPGTWNRQTGSWNP